MKSLIFVIAGFVSLSLSAQQKNVSINHNISDDGKKLSITIKGTVDGKPIDYNRTFDVTGMSKDDRNALKERVYDSLGLPTPVAPRPPVAPRAPIELRAPATLAEPAIPPVPAVPGQPTILSRNEYSEFSAVGGDHPYTKEINYDPKTGILRMKYRFVKDGAETTLQKSVEAKDKSKEERDLIIKKYEKEIGIGQPEMV